MTNETLPEPVVPLCSLINEGRAWKSPKLAQAMKRASPHEARFRVKQPPIDRSRNLDEAIQKLHEALNGAPRRPIHEEETPTAIADVKPVQEGNLGLHDAESNMKRRSLRWSEAVVAALQPFAGINDLEHTEAITKAQYEALWVRVAFALQTDWTEESAKEMATQYWHEAVGPAGGISLEQLFDQLCRLGDVWCCTLVESELAAFIQLLFGSLVEPIPCDAPEYRPQAPGQCRLRYIGEVQRLVGESCVPERPFGGQRPVPGLWPERRPATPDMPPKVVHRAPPATRHTESYASGSTPAQHTGAPSRFVDSCNRVTIDPEPTRISPINTLQHIPGYANKVLDREFVPMQNERRLEAQQERWQASGPKQQWADTFSTIHTHALGVEEHDGSHIDKYWEMVKATSDERSQPAARPLPGTAPRRLSVDPIPLGPPQHAFDHPRFGKAARSASVPVSSGPPAYAAMGSTKGSAMGWGASYNGSSTFGASSFNESMGRMMRTTSSFQGESLAGDCLSMYDTVRTSHPNRMPALLGQARGVFTGTVTLPSVRRPEHTRRAGIRRLVQRRSESAAQLFEDFHIRRQHSMAEHPTRLKELHEKQRKDTLRAQREAVATNTLGHHWDEADIEQRRPVAAATPRVGDELDITMAHPHQYKPGPEVVLQHHGGRSPVFRRRQGGSPLQAPALKKVEHTHLPTSPAHQKDLHKKLSARRPGPALAHSLSQQHLDHKGLRAHRNARCSEEQQMLMQTVKSNENPFRSRLAERRNSTLGPFFAKLPSPQPEVIPHHFDLSVMDTFMDTEKHTREVCRQQNDQHHSQKVQKAANIAALEKSPAPKVLPVPLHDPRAPGTRGWDMADQYHLAGKSCEAIAPGGPSSLAKGPTPTARSMMRSTIVV